MENKILTIICACLVVVGCKSTKSVPTIPDASTFKLAEAASSVSQSLRDLAEIEQASRDVPDLAEPPAPGSYGMADLASIDWTGPIEPLVRRIADQAHYKVRILGDQPKTPIIVAITARSTPIGDLMHDAGFQAGKRANIVIFPITKVVELRYANS